MENININETVLYKKNMKIHQNLWKIYTLTLGICLLVVITKGLI